MAFLSYTLFGQSSHRRMPDARPCLKTAMMRVHRDSLGWRVTLTASLAQYEDSTENREVMLRPLRYSYKISVTHAHICTGLSYLRLGMRHDRPNGMSHRNCRCSHFVVYKRDEWVTVKSNGLPDLWVQTAIWFLVFRLKHPSSK